MMSIFVAVIFNHIKIVRRIWFDLLC